MHKLAGVNFRYHSYIENLCSVYTTIHHTSLHVLYLANSNIFTNATYCCGVVQWISQMFFSIYRAIGIIFDQPYTTAIAETKS